MHAESTYARFPLPRQACESVPFIDRRTRGRGCLIVIEEDGVLIGMAAGYCDATWFADARVAGEYGIYIRPESRGGRSGVQLLRAYVEWCKSAKADLIQAGITTGVALGRCPCL
ncbi:hypothetical protein SNK04_014243 [Fusarium graminearum]